jgi:hypothetical protein
MFIALRDAENQQRDAIKHKHPPNDRLQPRSSQRREANMVNVTTKRHMIRRMQRKDVAQRFVATLKKNLKKISNIDTNTYGFQTDM